MKLSTLAAAAAAAAVLVSGAPAQTPPGASPEAKGDRAEAIRRLTEAVKVEDTLSYDEPADAFFPSRHLLGVALLRDGRPGEAEAVYRADLKLNPENGWALQGLAQALEAEKRTDEARLVRARYAKAWRRSDIALTASAF